MFCSLNVITAVIMYSEYLSFLVTFNFVISDHNALIFQSGRYVEYKFQRNVQVQEGYINLAFKTSRPDGLIFQLQGQGNAHITLVLQSGNLKLIYNFIPAETDGLSVQLKHPNAMGRFDDNKRHIIRIHHIRNQMYTYVLDDSNKPISSFRNISGPAIETSLFPTPRTLSVGKYNFAVPGTSSNFVGCISGFRYLYLPQKAHIGVTIDMQHMLVTKNSNLYASTPPPVNGSCGPALPTPSPLLPIVAPQQFNFRNPVVTVAPIGSSFTFGKVIVVIVVIVLAIFAIALFFVTLNCIDKYRRVYRRKEKDLVLLLKSESEPATSTKPYRQPEAEIPLRTVEREPAKPSYSPQTSYPPQGTSYAPSAEPAVAASVVRRDDDEEEDDDGFFL